MNKLSHLYVDSDTHRPESRQKSVVGCHRTDVESLEFLLYVSPPRKVEAFQRLTCTIEDSVCFHLSHQFGNLSAWSGLQKYTKLNRETCLMSALESVVAEI